MSKHDAHGVPQRRAASARDGMSFPWLAEVTSVIAHEIGNSLTVLAFATDALRERPSPPPAPSELDELCGAVAGASALVRLLARLAASSATAAARLDLRDVVSDAAPLFQRLASGRLRVALPDAAVPLVVARSDLERALVELVIGARDLAAGGGVLLAVEREPQGAIRIAVEALVEPGPPRAADPLRFAQELALACGGSLGAPRPGRIELSLPAARP